MGIWQRTIMRVEKGIAFRIHRTTERLPKRERRTAKEKAFCHSQLESENLQTNCVCVRVRELT